MKWTQPADGSLRTKRRFLFVPRSHGGETRWLEVAEWEEQYRPGGWMADWKMVRWLPPGAPRNR